MAKWQPIETAPVDVPVVMGWWETHNVGWSEDYKNKHPDELVWKTHAGFVKKTEKFWLFKRVVESYYGSVATHWIPLPEPPKL